MDTNNEEGTPSRELAFIRSRVQNHEEERKVHGSETIKQTIKTLDCTEIVPGRARGDRAIGIICPECVSTGLTSRVHIGCVTRTHAGIETYYDESGRRHSHDRNVSRADWSCTQGHAGSYRSVSGCSVTDCEKRGYTVLTTDPYNFKEARKERNRIADEERERKHAVEEAERIARGDPPPTYNTSICGGGDLIGTYPTSFITPTVSIGADGRIVNVTPTATAPGTVLSTAPGTVLSTAPGTVLSTAPGTIYYTNVIPRTHTPSYISPIRIDFTVPTAIVPTATVPTATVPTTTAHPDTIYMEVKYGDRTYGGVLTVKIADTDKK